MAKRDLLIIPFRANEVFEVRLDKMVAKWAGSIEIGEFMDMVNDAVRGLVNTIWLSADSLYKVKKLLS